MKKLYLLLMLLGWVLPYLFFIQFVVASGLNLGLFVRQIFANPIAAFFAVDLLISAVVFWAWLFGEAARYRMKYPWVYVLATLLIGVSFALPLFLYFRQCRIDSGQSPVGS